MRTHKIKIESRYEGTPIMDVDLQFLARKIGDLIASHLEHQYPDQAEFCDLGMTQELDITIGE